MLFRSKKENGQDSKQSSPTPEQAGGPKMSERKGATVATPMRDVAEPLPPEELNKRAETAEREAAAIGQIVTLMVGSPPHKDRKLSDLRVVLLPAIRTGQYTVASGQSRSKGYTRSLAAVLWASVSAEVDKRLSDPKIPARLGPAEWKSGNILWLVETIGDDRAIGALLHRLRGNEWKGKPVKVRMTDAKGQVSFRTIEETPAP